MSETSTSVPTPVTAIEPTYGADETVWYDIAPPWSATGIHKLTFAAFSGNAAAVLESPFYLEIEVDGQAVRCDDDWFFRVEPLESPGRWRVKKIPTLGLVGLKVFGFGITASSSDTVSPGNERS